MMLVWFIIGLGWDLWFGRRLGQTSFILLVLARLARPLMARLPRKIDRQIKLK